MAQTTNRSERLHQAMTLLARRGTLTRFHGALMQRTGADIDRACYLVLRRLHLDGASRITDLADLMGVEPSTASRHVHVLEKRGWLVKRSDASDGRVAVAEVTHRGAELVDRIEAERGRILDRALSGWTDAEVDRFVELFARFAGDLSDALSDLE